MGPYDPQRQHFHPTPFGPWNEDPYIVRPQTQPVGPWASVQSPQNIFFSNVPYGMRISTPNYFLMFVS